jgi:hypothetical protein
MSSDVTSVIDPVEKPRAAVPTKGTARSFWIKQFYVWHWVSGAFALAAMIFFAGTGITLNHAANFSAKPRVTRTQTKLPAHLLAKIATDTGGAEKARQVVPVEVRDWLRTELDSDPGARKVEWTADEIYIDLPRPGGDGWLTIDRASGDIEKEVTMRGVIAWLNDLHKGRHTGTSWILFMDFFSVVSVVFSVTGLALLVVHARRRPMTWPVVVAGIALPIVLILFFLHL